jgi:hypothetical protein
LQVTSLKVEVQDGDAGRESRKFKKSWLGKEMEEKSKRARFKEPKHAAPAHLAQ